MATPPSEFARVMALLEAGCGKKLGDAQVEVYFAMLAHVPLKTLWLAAQRALTQPLYNAFPTVELLLRMAMEIESPPVPTFAEAWALALRADARLLRDVRRDYIVHRGGKRYLRDEWNDAVYASLPPPVARALRCIGELRNTETCRAQFRQMYEGIVTEVKVIAMLPVEARREMEQIGHQRSAEVAELIPNLKDGNVIEERTVSR